MLELPGADTEAGVAVKRKSFLSPPAECPQPGYCSFSGRGCWSSTTQRDSEVLLSGFFLPSNPTTETRLSGMGRGMWMEEGTAALAEDLGSRSWQFPSYVSRSRN